jgi:hypothetical protein
MPLDSLSFLLARGKKICHLMIGGPVKHLHIRSTVFTSAKTFRQRVREAIKEKN